MDALNVLRVAAEVSRVVHLVLEEDAGRLVADEEGGLDVVVVGHEEVVAQTARGDGELQVCTGLHVAVSDGVSPHLDSVEREGVLRGGLLIFAVSTFVSGKYFGSQPWLQIEPVLLVL